MVKKINLWEKEIQKNNCEPFERLHKFLQDNETNLSDFTKLKTQMSQHLNSLQVGIREYFPPLDKQYNRIRYPFVVDATDTNLTIVEKEQLIEVSSDPTLKNKYLSSGNTLLNFWIGVGKEHKEQSSTAGKFLVGFSTSYLCERGFSSLTYLKSKYRNKLNVEDDLRLYLTKLESNIDELCKQKQAHPSH
ncbi:zinc finger BED domain-containing protein 5-like [Leptinotarsa decemlineata]|uniref:zinc finger BED domain-containing protein 5-like n=1 Tax=Leptinotarsa decemlineata TaxID=7539 RepID=UPI003D30C182